MTELKIIATIDDGQQKAKVFLDDKELKGVIAIDINMVAGELYTATITVVPKDIHIEGNFQVYKKEEVITRVRNSKN